jgi:2-polyprenyl-3-methyl-5-hydroxy-6-metoxy-1,4-benzoquinol methylase
MAKDSCINQDIHIMLKNKSNHKVGQFNDYGELIHLQEKYIVKQRQDLLLLLPTNRTYNSIIEFGCADGTNLSFFSDKLNIPHDQIFGVDICSSIYNKNNFKFFHQSAEEFLLQDNNSYELILLSDVLEHIYNPWKMLIQIKSKLTTNGCLLISVPNLQNLNYLNAVNSGEFNYTSSGLFDETHVRFFSLKTLSNYLESLGYKILKTSFRPDHSLSKIQQVAQNHFLENSHLDIKLNNLTVRLDKNNLNIYTGQQVLICATNC